VSERRVLLREISELAQDPNEARDGDALEQRLGLLLRSAVEVGVPQADLIPQLEPDERHGRSTSSFITAPAAPSW
jgi:hypothetical protein